MTRHKFGSESSKSSTQWLPVGELKFDQTVQRSLNPAWAAHIGKELDPDLIGILKVSRRRDGDYVIDGQHRVVAVRDHFGNNGTLIECQIFEGLNRADEAKIFVGTSNNRLLTALEKFLKGAIAKDPTAVEITKIVESVGFTVASGKLQGRIPAVGALRAVYFGFTDGSRQHRSGVIPAAEDKKPELLRSTLNVIKAAWGGTADSLTGSIIEGVGRLLAARQRSIDLGDLARDMASYPGGPMALIGAARMRASIAGGNVGSGIAEVLVDIYNKGRRVGKIEPLR